MLNLWGGFIVIDVGVIESFLVVVGLVELVNFKKFLFFCELVKLN